MPRTITPFFEPRAYEVTGKSDSRCGTPMPCPAAQRLSEVHVVTGAGFETATRGLLGGMEETTVATGLKGCGANDLATAGLVQFSGDEITGPVSVMTSGGGGDDCVAHPARKSSTPQKMIPANLNTRQLCGMENRTQAFTIDDIRFAINAICPVVLAASELRRHHLQK